MADNTLWWIAIAAALVVTLVVGLLLYAIISSAERIRHRLVAIWGRGQMIANNTIHIPLLERVVLNLRNADEAAERLAFVPDSKGKTVRRRSDRQ